MENVIVDILYLKGFRFLGGDGSDKRYFDEQDTLVDPSGNVIYWPEMKSCFEAAEKVLEDIASFGSGSFTCGPATYVFKNYILTQPKADNQSKLKVYEDASKKASQIADEWDRTLEQIEIASMANKAGLTEKSKKLFGDLLSEVKTIKDESNQSGAYRRIGVASMETGLPKVAYEAFSMAVDSLKKLTDSNELMNICIGQLVASFAETKFESEKTIVLLKRLADIAKAMPLQEDAKEEYADPCICSLAAVALAQARYSLKDESMANFEKAISLAPAIKNGSSRI